MAADQPNRQYFTYVDNNGTSWNKLGKLDAGCNALDGSAAAGAFEDYPAGTRRRHARKAIFQDPTTFRTAQCVIYTSAAFNALTSASTLAVHIQGETAAVTYNLVNKVPGRDPVNSASRQLPDHA